MKRVTRNVYCTLDAMNDERRAMYNKSSAFSHVTM